jgi:membrane protease YdiL (CAAX protease family)
MQEIPEGLFAFIVGSVLASVAGAWWVYRDSRARFGSRRNEPWLWAIGTLALLILVLPFYLLFARPPGGVVRCPSCGSMTLSHRATCLHCDQPIPFDSRPAMWGLGEIVGIALIFALTLPLFAASLGIGEAPEFREFSIYAVVQSVLLGSLSLYVVTRRYHQSPDLLGLRTDRLPTLAGAGALIGAAMVFISTGVEEVSIALVSAVIGRDQARQMAEAEHLRNPVTEMLVSGVSPAELIWILMVLCLIVPVAEEIFFRGFVYRGLRARWGMLTGTLGSAAFFGVVHLEVVHFLPIFVLGVVVAYTFERTRSLVPAIVIHALNNVVAVFGTIYRWDI